MRIPCKVSISDADSAGAVSAGVSSGRISVTAAALVCPSIRSYNPSSAGSVRKFPITITSASGAAFTARAESCDWQTTTSVPAGIVSTELLLTRTALPSGSMRLRKRVAPIALDPIPASQAKMTVRIGASIARTTGSVPPIIFPLGF